MSEKKKRRQAEADYFRAQDQKEFEMSPELKKGFREEAKRFKENPDPNKANFKEVGARRWGLNRIKDILGETKLTQKELDKSTQTCEKKVKRSVIEKAQDRAEKDCRRRYNSGRRGRDTKETKVCKIEVRKGVALAKKDIQK